MMVKFNPNVPHTQRRYEKMKACNLLGISDQELRCITYEVLFMSLGITQEQINYVLEQACDAAIRKGMEKGIAAMERKKDK